MKEIVEALEFEYPGKDYITDEVNNNYFRYLLIIYREPVKYSFIKSLINKILFNHNKIEYNYEVDVIYRYKDGEFNVYNRIFNSHLKEDAFFRVPLLKKKGWDIVKELKEKDNSINN